LRQSETASQARQASKIGEAAPARTARTASVSSATKAAEGSPAASFGRVALPFRSTRQRRVRVQTAGNRRKSKEQRRPLEIDFKRVA